MLENMYHNMTYEELARETRRSDCKLAIAVIEKCDETLETSVRGFENLKTDTMVQLNSCVVEMNRTLRLLVNDLIEAKGNKRKSQGAVQRFKDRCENMSMSPDYLETFSVLWDISTD